MSKLKYALAAGLAAVLGGQASAQVSLTPTPGGVGITGPAGNTVTLGNGGVGVIPSGSFYTPGFSSGFDNSGYYPSTGYYAPSTSYYTPGYSSNFYTPSTNYYTPGYSSSYYAPSTSFYTPGYSSSYYAPSSSFYAPNSGYYSPSFSGYTPNTAWNTVNTVRTVRRLFR